MKRLATTGLMVWFSTVWFSAACFGTAHAADWDHAQNIQNGVKQFLAAYKNAGMSGAVTLVRNCYQGVQKLPRKSDQKLKKMEQCVSADLAAYQLDKGMSEQTGFPPNDFFVLDKVGQRVDQLAEWFPDPEQRGQVIGGLTRLSAEQFNKLAK